MSSAKAAILYCFLVIPWMSAFLPSLRRKGSRVRMNNMGERGHPWRVPFLLGKAFDSSPFTCIFALGFVLRDIMKPIS